jgi:hypothetical protein
MRVTVILLTVLLAACGGSGSSGTDPSSDSAPASAPSASTPPAASSPTPAAQTCPSGDTGTYPDCVAPGPTSTPTPPPVATLPTCSAGTTLAPLACQCPPAYLDADNGSCIVPTPAVPPPAFPPPTMSLSAAPDPVQPGGSAVLTWSSTGVDCFGAAGWPTSDELTPSGFVNTASLSGTTSYTLICSGPGGNAEASVTVGVSTSTPTQPPPTGPPVPPTGPPVPPTSPPVPPTCTAPQVLIGNTCQEPPTVALSLALTPTVVVDSSLGCPSPAGQPCLATIATTPVSSFGADSFFCSMSPSTQIQSPAEPFGLGPFPSSQDGPVVATVICTDVYNQTASASVTLTVIPPSGPPSDTFTGSLSGNVETLTWDTYGSDGCYVEQFNTNGVEVTLSPGGGTSGTAPSGFLSPSYEPYNFVLYCGGAPDTNVPSITVNP